MKLFCSHEFEFSKKAQKTHYFLWYSTHSTYYYGFKCRKCDKEKWFRISWAEYYKKDILLLEEQRKLYSKETL